MKRLVIGLLGILLGIFIGVYLGVWVCLIGGILGLVSAFITMTQDGSMDYALIGFSILKIVLAGIIGHLSALMLIVPSLVYMKKN